MTARLAVLVLLACSRATAGHVQLYPRHADAGLLSSPQLLAPEQAQSIIDVVSAAGADPSHTLMTLRTTNGKEVTIRTSGQQLVKTWNAPNETAGDQLVKILQRAKVDLPGVTTTLRKRSFSYIHSVRQSSLFRVRDLERSYGPRGGRPSMPSNPGVRNAALGSTSKTGADCDTAPDRTANAAVVNAAGTTSGSTTASGPVSAESLIAELATPNFATPSPPPPPAGQSAAVGQAETSSINSVQNGQASAASNSGNTAVDGSDAFAQSDGSGASVSNGANSAFLSGQGTIAASGTTPGGLVVAVLGSSDAAPTAAAASTRNFNVLVGGVNGLQYSPNQVEAQPGDTISFVFGTKNHTLTQSTFADPCKAMDGGANSGFLASSNDLETTDTSGSPVVQYTVVDTAPRWFYCAQGNHCSQGMVFAVNANANKSFSTFTKAAAVEQASGGAAGGAAITSTEANAAAFTNSTAPSLIDGTSTSIATDNTNSTAGSAAVLGSDLSGNLTDTSTSGISSVPDGSTISAAGLSTDTSGGCLQSDGVLAVDNEGGCFLLLSPNATQPVV